MPRTMAKPSHPNDARTRAEQRFQKVTTKAEKAPASSIGGTEQDAQRKKTAGLKAQRIAKEAREGKTELDGKAKLKRPRATR